MLIIQRSSINQELNSLEKSLINLQGQLTSLTKEQHDIDLADIELRIKNIEEKKEQLVIQKGAAKGFCESISSTDPYAAVEKAKV